MAKEKKKLGKIRLAFNCAGAVFLGVYFAGPQIAASRSNTVDDIARRLDLDPQSIPALAGHRAYFLYPEKKSSSRFAWMTFSPEVIRTTKEQRHSVESHAPTYDFYGFAYRDTVFGPGGYLDKATFGLGGKLSPCYVFFPSEKLSLDDIREALSGLPVNQLRPAPGALKDYLRLILYHETGHCHQTVGTAPAASETDADRRSFDTFLKKGGDPEIVRNVLNMRALSAMNMLVFYENDKDLTPPHGQIANLYPRYFGGTALSSTDYEAAMAETLVLLQKQARLNRLDNLDLLSHRRLYAVARDLLHNSALDVSPRARILLGRYLAAYEATVMPAKPAQNPALAL